MDRLPAELLYEIHLFSVSDALPWTNSHLHAVFTTTSTSHRVSYLVGRYEEKYERKDKHGRKVNASARGPIAHALLYRLCTEPVLDALFAYYAARPPDPNASPLDSWVKETPLPRRLFTAENMPPSSSSNQYTTSSPPLPLLRHLYSLFSLYNLSPLPSANAHNGYALTRAVFASHLPLATFLLSPSICAKPAANDALAVRVAIRKRDLGLVRMLVEGEELQVTSEGKVKVKGGGMKRRRISDRVDVNAGMLKEAVEVGAKDVVRYLLDKGARPDMQVMARI